MTPSELDHVNTRRLLLCEVTMAPHPTSMVEYTTLPYPSIYLFKPSVLPYLIPPYADRDNMNMDLEMNVAANRLLWRGLGEGKATDGQPR